jgi:hypothetical protein
MTYENITKQYKNIYENIVVFAISNELHKWLDTITTRNPFNSNHSFMTCVQINHFCDFWCNCLSCHMVKMIVIAYSTTKWFKVAYATMTCN